MSINKLLNISSNSLSVYQKALTVTSHNIANVNNENYSRQRALIIPEATDNLNGLIIGSGVTIEDISRVKNSLLEKQIINYNKQFGYTDQQEETLGAIEGLYSEPKDQGISTLLNKFFDSWDKLANDPSSQPYRDEVVNSANQLSTKMENIYEGTRRIQQDARQDAVQTVEQVNLHLQNIHSLNEQIYNQVALGSSPNDLLDERDKAILELSKLVNVNVTYGENQVASISIGNSFGADRKFHNEYEVVEDNGKIIMRAKNDTSNQITVHEGKLAALIDLHNTEIPNQLQALDDFGNALVNQINSVHSTGYYSHDTPLTGENFSEIDGQGVLKINENILNDTKYIAVSKDGTKGNNELARAMAELKTYKDASGNTFEENYSKMISDIANKKKHNEQKSKSFELVIQQMNVQKAEYSGVSIDEEMVDVLKFQRSFDASAKLISIADELLQTLINLV
ncbi:MAG: flagellar hook-associated protein FlgK [Rhodothermaceae bacterium]